AHQLRQHQLPRALPARSLAVGQERRGAGHPAALRAGDPMTATLEGKLTRERVKEALAELERDTGGDAPILIDLSRVTEADSAGVALLSVFARRMQATGRVVRVLNPSSEMKKKLALFPFPSSDVTEERIVPTFLEHIGDTTLYVRDLFFEYLV